MRSIFLYECSLNFIMTHVCDCMILTVYERILAKCSLAQIPPPCPPFIGYVACLGLLWFSWEDEAILFQIRCGTRGQAEPQDWG